MYILSIDELLIQEKGSLKHLLLDAWHCPRLFHQSDAKPLGNGLGSDPNGAKYKEHRPYDLNHRLDHGLSPTLSGIF